MDRSDTRYYEMSRLEENLDATNVQLTTGDFNRIRSSLAEINVEGERYPEELDGEKGLKTQNSYEYIQTEYATRHLPHDVYCRW